MEILNGHGGKSHTKLWSSAKSTPKEKEKYANLTRRGHSADSELGRLETEEKTMTTGEVKSPAAEMRQPAYC